MKKNYSIIVLNALPDKKIKSLGNKYLIKISKKYNVIDYVLKFLNQIFDDPEIIIVGGFDSKRLKKYIDGNFTDFNIKFVEHEIDNSVNVGASITFGMSLVSNENCLIINTCLLFNKNIVSLLNKNLSHSFVLTNKEKGSIGYTIENKYLLNCYYDLPNNIIDILNISKYDFNKFYEISQSKINKMYFFEILNVCIEKNIKLIPLNVSSKYIHAVDSIHSIEKIKRKICTT